MGLFDTERVSVVVKHEDHEIPFVIIAMGKLGDYSKADDGMVDKESVPSSRRFGIAKEIEDA